METRQNDRAYWVQMLKRIAEPVLTAGAEGRLHQQMPVERHPGASNRHEVTHLEAIGRLAAGIAPWLELGEGDDDEGRLRAHLADLMRRTIAHATDPQSPDFCNFTQYRQPLVDAAFLAQGLLRAPAQLWRRLDENARRNVIEALRSTRQILPPSCNWLLFSATIEAFFRAIGETWDPMRVDYAIRQHEAWYKGDGHYGDGSHFHADYYNAFVIHPMLVDISLSIDQWLDWPNWAQYRQRMVDRAVRFAVVQERMISPEGTLPPIGRSLTYRFGALQVLAQIALRRLLPQELQPAQVRCAMTAVLKRMMEAPGTFDVDGWLTIGLCGHQPSLGEPYISTGSLYLCSVGFLPLGLPAEDPFWAGPFMPWTSKRIYELHEDSPADHAMAD